MKRFEFYMLSFLMSFVIEASADTVGDARDNRLLGSEGFDEFYGGAGADVFVVDRLSERPDRILDFQPEEGDLIEIVAERIGLPKLDASQFSVSRRGVLRVQLEGEDVPLVDLGRSELTIKLDSKKGKYLLRFYKEL